MKTVRDLLMAAMTAGLTALPISAHAYSTIYSFGDSLSDVGNVFIGTSGAQPAAPYFQGEFSNGPNWIQDLSVALGNGPSVPYLAGGTNFAFGGATTGFAATVTPSVPVPTLTAQVGAFLTAHPAAPSSALYTVWIGSNDMFNVAGAYLTGSITQTVALGAAAGAAQTEAANIAALVTAGARTILVPLVGDLGTTPTLSGTPGGPAEGTFLASAYDTALQADLATISAPGLNISVLDTFHLLDNAAAFGFTNTTSACYVGPYTGGGTVCATPNTYLFWDQLHPTATADAIVAAAAFNEVPEPGTFGILSAALAGLGAVRQRRQISASARRQSCRP